MSLKTGIVGLPNVGKSTLFNAITNSQVEAANYPFATIEPNTGIVELKDERLTNIANIVKPEKIIYATFEFTDIAGLVEGASKGDGLGNKFLSNIREVDAIIHVVRAFEDLDVTHVNDKIDPVSDAEIINTELILADLESIERIISKVMRKAKASEKEALKDFNIATKIKDALEKEVPAIDVYLSDEEQKIAKQWNLLTGKKVIYVANVDEKYASNPNESKYFQKLKEYALKKKSKIIGISAKIESEISQLDDMDKNLFLADLGLKESGLNKLSRAAFHSLDLKTFFTAGIKEVRAWTFHGGAKAPQAAGVIHTDFEKGFIKAAVIGYQDFISNGGEQQAKLAGKQRLEGKDYIVKDGDICEFKFNV